MRTPIYVAGSGVSLEVIGTTGNAVTFALNAGSAAGRTVVVAVEYNVTTIGAPTGVTYNGVAMTPFTATVTNGGSSGANVKLRAYYLPNAPSGSNNVVISFSTNGNIRYTGGAFSGCDTVAPIQNQSTATGGPGQTFSVSVNNSSGQLAIMFGQAFANATGTFTPGTGCTTDYFDNGGVSSVDNWEHYIVEKAGASLQTVNGTVNGPTVTDWFAYGFSLQGTSSGPAIPSWNAPGVGPNPARIGRQFAFMGSTFIRTPSGGIIAIGSSGGSGGGIGTNAAGSAN